MLEFKRFESRPAVGSFTLSDPLLRRMFSALSTPRTLFGLRLINDEGTSRGIGLWEPQRTALQDACRDIGGGQQVGTLQRLLTPYTGITINSPQTFDSSDPFDEISHQFLTGIGCAEGEYPETIYVTIYFGTYRAGFGLHSDPGEDTALFVLDGTKNFVLVDNGTEQRYALERGQYLAWGSGQEHCTANPRGDWSVTIHFAVGSPGVTGPVQYRYPRTRRHIAYAA